MDVLAVPAGDSGADSSFSAPRWHRLVLVGTRRHRVIRLMPSDGSPASVLPARARVMASEQACSSQCVVANRISFEAYGTGDHLYGSTGAAAGMKERAPW